jgi:hypothetical protein
MAAVLTYWPIKEAHMPTTTNVIRGMDHIGVTVPNLDEASRFLEAAFDATPLYDNIKRTDEPLTGPKAEALFGLAPGTTLVTIRMMRLRNGAGIELFEMHGPEQRPRYDPATSACSILPFMSTISTTPSSGLSRRGGP